MKSLISGFSQHIEDALNIIKASDFKSTDQPIQNVVISGLGGSGIGGTIISEIIEPIANVPVTVNKGYSIPSFVSESTLFIACSYSGNTEETLMATKAAIQKGSQVACITSGGELMNVAKENGFNVISMQGGNPPRAMLAYSFSFLCHIVDFYGIASIEVNKQLAAAAGLLDKEKAAIHEEAEQIAKKLFNKTAIFYAVKGNTGIASRWRQQFNENAKMLAWEAEIPEMNHNELVGWEGGNSQFVPVFLRNKDDFDRNQKRIEIIKEIMAQKTDLIIEIWSKGESSIDRALYLVHLGDWISYYLSELNQVDILDIKSIDLLKAELAKLPLDD